MGGRYEMLRMTFSPSDLRVTRLAETRSVHLLHVFSQQKVKELTTNVHDHPISDDLITNTQSVAATRRLVLKR